MDARQEAIGERLRAREAVRRKCIEQADDSMATAKEQVIDKFGADFARCRSTIEALLTTEHSDSTTHLDQLQAELQTAQKLVSDVQLYLPSYDKQVANRILGQWLTAFDDRRDKLAPKKKFAFRSRKKDSGMASGDVVDAAVSIQPQVIVTAVEPAPPTIDASSECDYRNRTSETISERADVVNGKDVSFHNLADCRVRIHGSPSTVHIVGLSDCTVLLGPVATSVFVDDCRRLTLAVACQQLRVHATTDSNFYVHVSSRSVIEDSRRLRFAPYAWRYDGIDEHYRMAGLDCNAMDRWNAVDDFDWLVAGEPSPNWSVMDERDRVDLQ